VLRLAIVLQPYSLQSVDTNWRCKHTTKHKWDSTTGYSYLSRHVFLKADLSRPIPLPFSAPSQSPPCMVLEQLQDGQHQVIHIAEATGFSLLSMVQAATPVDGRVTQPMVEPHCTLDAGTRIHPAQARHSNMQRRMMPQQRWAC